MYNSQQISEAVDYIKGRVNINPEIAIILGSGLGNLANVIEDKIEIEYKDIPNFPVSTVPGHAGRLIFGKLADKEVLAMQGRFHIYEGYAPQCVVFPVRVFKKLGVESLFVTNAAGAVNKDFKAGQLMIIEDHISFFCPSPLRGSNDDEFGSRFPSMSSCYDKDYIKKALSIAQRNGMDVAKGVYCYCQGPMFETPAEIKAIRILGADAVGMSTVPEVITAVHAGMKVLGISCITNMAAGILDVPLSHEEVLEAGKKVENVFSRYVIDLIKEL